MSDIIRVEGGDIAHSALRELRGQWPAERGLERVTNEPPEIAANNDLAAMSEYLRHVQANYADRTFEAYQREIQRFAYWCCAYHRRSLSDMLHGDWEAYRQFLIDPPAAEVGPHGARLENRKLFSARGRSPNTVAYAMKVLSGMLEFLVDRLYLRRNIIGNTKRWLKGSAPQAERAEDDAQKIEHKRIPRRGLEAVAGWVAAMPEDTPDRLEAKVRLRALLVTAFGLALRRAELAAMRWEQVRWDPITGGFVWRGRTKGGKTMESPIPPRTMDALGDYRMVLGMAREPSRMDEGPVFRKIASNVPKGGDSPARTALTGRRVADLMQQAFRGAAGDLALSDAGRDAQATANLLEQATAHWMRHTRASELVEGGLTMAETAKVLNHASPATTQKVYAHADRQRLAQSEVYRSGVL